ncbi:MAG TPA: acyl-CoA thioesterase [Balneolaceae bacterium]|nr:acyl-CoA thioesterase [Balneolaceae bacterium]
MDEPLAVSILRMKVGWGDCDAAGITYYARYFDWFCDARFKLLNDYNLKYTKWFHPNDLHLVVLETGCDYKNIIRPEETILVETALISVSRSRAQFNYHVKKNNTQLAASGFTKHAYVDLEGNPCNIEKYNPELWKKISQTFLKS